MAMAQEIRTYSDFQEIRTYSDLLQKIHSDLRIQHPEWVEPNGDSPICDSYQARFAELLGLNDSREDDAANS